MTPDPHGPDRACGAGQLERAWSLSTVDGSRAAAEELLGGQFPRLSHVRAVAAFAEELADRLGLDPGPRCTLLRAAWLHDIGYARSLRSTGFHPLDGARWLAGWGEPRLARLVANHSAAVVGARMRGLSLEDFPPLRGVVADLLDYADLCTGPRGERLSPAERLAEILRRHPPGSAEHEEALIARPRRLLDAVRFEARWGLGEAGDRGCGGGG